MGSTPIRDSKIYYNNLNMPPLIITNDIFFVKVAHTIAVLIVLGSIVGTIILSLSGTLTQDKLTFPVMLGFFGLVFYFVVSLANKDKSIIKLESGSMTITTSKETKIIGYTDIQEIRPTVESFRQTKTLPGPLKLNINTSTTIYVYLKSDEEIPLGIISVADIQKMNDYIKQSFGKDFMSKYL